MSRSFFEDGVEIVLEDLNRASQVGERTLYDRIVYELVQRAEDSFFSDSFKVNFASGTSLTMLKGVGFQSDVSQTGPEPQKRLLYRGVNANINLQSPDASNDRIDIITVKAALVDEITATRKFKDAITDVVSDQSLVVQRDWEAEIVAVAGTPAASPVAPALPADYIQIAEVLVSAVTGVAGSGSITDNRTLMPIGGSIGINTLGASRLTAGASVGIEQLINEIEVFLQAGLQDYTDIIENNTPTAEVGNPAVDRQRMYYRDGVLFLKDSTGSKVPVGSGAGGGGGANWKGDALEEVEFGEAVKRFTQGDSQSETLYVKIPQGFLSGRQVQMFLGVYSPSVADEYRIDTTTSLIRKEVDAINSSANQHVSNSGDLTNDATSNKYREVTLNLTSATGTLNGFAASAGDILKVELTRGTPGGTNDSADVRFIPSSTEVKFG